jgi:hypothetical protein
VPDQVLVNASELERLQSVGRMGPYLQHLYEVMFTNFTCFTYVCCLQIRNLGPSSAGRVVTRIQIPYTVSGGLNLFNFTKTPQVLNAHGQCSVDVQSPKPEPESWNTKSVPSRN